MSDGQPLLSVVVPVFNQAASIVGNLEVIRERIEAELGSDFEIVVVSDGSIDATEEALVAEAPAGAFRVLHYDRNLGKGYAVKVGALESRGRWVGFVDADLDLDPASLAAYVAAGEADGLDFAIGSKRHPGSEVHYPRSRVVASWMFQQLVRLLFRLNVRDTQVGLKVFRREVADQVLPLLMVKRYAFDIELLAVARAFGFTRIAEMPVKLDYRFTGSGVRSRAVLRAVVDTFAVFYRLRILRYYQRRRRFSGAYAFTRPQSTRPRVTVLLPEGVRFRERDFPSVELIAVREGGTVGAYREAALRADGEVIAILEPGVRAAGNWLSATTPFLARSEIGAVVTPKVAPATGSHHARAAAAVVESRVGAGFGYFRHTPGNIRYVRSYPASGIVIRRATLLQLPDDTALVDLVAAVARTGEQVLYTPEAVVVADPAPLFRPHLRFVASRARTRAKGVRRGREAIGLAAAAGVAAVLAVLLLVLFNAGIELAAVVAGAAVLYGIALCVASAAAMFRFQSAVVGALTFAGIVSTHVVYVGAFAHGLLVG